MNYAKINQCDIANGEGVRVTLFVCGCRNRCPGCFQPETWDFDYGSAFTETVAEELFSAMENPSVRGLTVLGGEPMEPENQKALLPFLLEFKRRFSDKTIWLYTGYKFDEIADLPYIKHIDVLVDGEFELEKRDTTAHWVGSTNQRVIDVKQTLKSGNICLH